MQHQVFHPGHKTGVHLGARERATYQEQKASSINILQAFFVGLKQENMYDFAVLVTFKCGQFLLNLFLLHAKFEPAQCT